MNKLIMKSPTRLKSQKGQLIVEAVLIIVVLMGVTFAAASYFKNEELLKKLISDPWQNLAGLLQNGVWGTPEKTAEYHPTGHFRHIVITGTDNIYE